MAVLTNWRECSHLGPQALNDHIWSPIPHLERAYDVGCVVWHSQKSTGLAVPLRHRWSLAKLSELVKPHAAVELSYSALNTGHSSGEPENGGSWLPCVWRAMYWMKAACWGGARLQNAAQCVRQSCESVIGCGVAALLRHVRVSSHQRRRRQSRRCRTRDRDQ